MKQSSHNETVDASKGLTPERSSSRSSWAEWALACAGLTIVLITALSVARVPHAITHLTIFGIGSLLYDTDKSWMLLLWICGAASIGACLLVDRLTRELRLPRSIQVVISGLALLGFSLTFVLSTWQDATWPGEWVGFGFGPALLGVVFAIVLLLILESRRFNHRSLLLLSIVVVTVLSIAPLLQTPETFGSGYNNAFTLDEILAPADGRLPGFDYITQYESLLGFPLALVRAVIPNLFTRHPESFAVAWLVLLQIVTIGLAIFAVIKVAPRRIHWLIPVIVVPVAYLVGSAGLQYYADLPMRLFLPTVLLALFVVIGRRRIARSWVWWLPLSLGAVAGVGALNNLDYGISAALAGFIAVTLPCKRWGLALRTAVSYVVGLIFVPIAYIALGTLTGRTFHPSYALFLVQSFGVGDQGNVDMTPFGLQDGFVLLGLVGVVVGSLGVRRATLKRAILFQAILFQSWWLLFSLVYFSGRSLTPTLVTGSSLQAGVLLALLVTSGFPHFRLLRRAGISSWRRPDWMAIILIVFSLALPLAAWGSFPSIQTAEASLANPVIGAPAALSYLQPDPTPALAALPRHTKLMGLLSQSGSVWSLRLGIVNADLFLHPNYIQLDNGTTVECKYLKSLRGGTLLTTRYQLLILVNSPTCGEVLNFSTEKTLLQASPGTQSDSDWMTIQKR